MHRKKTLSKEFISSLSEIAAFSLSAEKFEVLIELFEKEIKNHFFTHSSESNLLRIIRNFYDKSFLLNEIIEYPHYAEILISISSNSNYLTDIIVRNPEYFYFIVNPSNLKEVKKEKLQDEIEHINEIYRSFSSRLHALKSLKRKHILRIGLMDILQNEKLEIITSQLSELAESTSSALFKSCNREILFKHKIEKVNRKYAIVALGKLGGKELNYSSDIDLIIFSDKNPLLNNKVYYNELLSEAVKLFIESSSAIDHHGFLYRIDFRLRPYGKYAPLAGSLSEYLNYYETKGEDWERQMLIKASLISGDKTLYKKFYSYLKAFIYPTSFKVSPAEQIRSLKNNIEKKLDEDNIKLSPGGIRDIEFSVQALQLLYGGRNESIRNSNTINSINLLFKYDFLSNQEYEVFLSAYVFYRKVEHYLQLMNDKQTHTIPEEGEMLNKISFFLGYESVKEFKKDLNLHRKKVRGIYNSIIGEKTEQKKNILEAIHFNDLKRAEYNYKFLSEGKGLVSSSSFNRNVVEDFSQIEKYLFEYLSASVDSDKVLENFSRIIKTANLPSIWYSEFKEKKFFYLFLDICHHSQKAVDLFAEDKLLRDSLLSRSFLIPLKKKTLNELSHKQILFILCSQLTVKQITQEDVRKILTLYYKIKISSLLLEETKKMKWKDDYFIAALGSLGSSEVTFSSDLDMIAVVRNIKKFPGIQRDFQDLLNKLKQEFPFTTVDFRLRPEGKSSQLVWDINEYKKYLSLRARVWEFQAFTKLSFISGNKNLFTTFKRNVVKKWFENQNESFHSEIKEMRKKMFSQNSLPNQVNIKRDKGGLLDVQFIAETLMMKNENLYKRCMGKSTSKILRIVEEESQVKLDFELLKQNYKFLTSIEIVNQNIFNSSLPRISFSEDKLKLLSSFNDEKKDLKKLIRLVMSGIHKEYIKIFGK